MPFRHVAAPGRYGATPPPDCGALWRMPQLGKCARATTRQAAGRLARVSADLGSESGLTEKRTLQPTQPQQCTQMPQNGSEGPFSPICVHSLSPRPLVRPGRATGPTTSTAPWPHDARTLGPEAHAAEAAAHLRCQALFSPLVALECHRHGMRRMPEQGQFGWSSRLARFNAWGL